MVVMVLEPLPTVIREKTEKLPGQDTRPSHGRHPDKQSLPVLDWPSGIPGGPMVILGRRNPVSTIIFNLIFDILSALCITGHVNYGEYLNI